MLTPKGECEGGLSGLSPELAQSAFDRVLTLRLR